MPKTRENQHRWKKSLDPHVVEVLEETAERLEISWEFDSAYPNSYPVNTDYALAETRAQLRGKAPVEHSLKDLLKSRVPEKSTI